MPTNTRHTNSQPPIPSKKVIESLSQPLSLSCVSVSRKEVPSHRSSSSLFSQRVGGKPRTATAAVSTNLPALRVDEIVERERHLHPKTPLKLHRRRQTRNLPIILREHIRRNRVFSRWNLRRQVNLLGNLGLPGFDGTFHVHLLDLLAQVRFGGEELDESVLDLQDDVGACVDILLKRAEGFDDEGLSTVILVSTPFTTMYYPRPYHQSSVIGGGVTHAKGGFGFRFTCSSVRISSANSAVQCSSGDTPGIFLSTSSTRRDCPLSPPHMESASAAAAARRRGARNFIVFVACACVIRGCSVGLLRLKVEGRLVK